MEDIYHFIKIISKTQINNLDVIHGLKNVNNQYKRLFLLLTNNEKLTEEDLAEKFFPNHPKQKIYFSNLKSRFLEKLINTILVLEPPKINTSNFKTAYIKIIKYEAIIKTLLANEQRQPALYLTDKGLKIAIKYEFTDSVIYFSSILKNHFGFVEGHFEKHMFYLQILEKNMEILKHEAYAESIYSKLIIPNVRSSFPNQNLSLFSEEIEKLKEIRKKIQSPKFILYSGYAISTYFQIKGDYQRVIEECTYSLSLLKEKKYKIGNLIKSKLIYPMIEAFIQLGKFQEAESKIKILNKYFIKGTNNWVLTNRYRVITALYQEDYGYAEDIFKKANKEIQGNKYISEISRELWKILEGFISFIGDKNGSKNIASKNHFPFRLGKLINELQIFSKDKSGFNSNILILKMLSNLQRKNYAQIIDEEDALKKYAHRYLKKEVSFRINCMFKMLLQITAGNFTRSKVERKAKKYLNLLNDRTIKENIVNIEVEVMPYDKLWQYILEMLED